MISSEADLKNLKGLSQTQATERLKKEGPNEIPAAGHRGILKIVWGVLREPMFLLLVACGTIYLVLGDFTEAIMLLGFVFVIMGITVYQEGKTERAVEALRDLSSPRALVIRDGQSKRISGREVVREDIMIIKEGDRVPADALLLWGMNIEVDESLLTGESLPVRKRASAAQYEQLRRPGGHDLPFLYSGTLLVHGQGVAQVVGTGASAEIGKIGKALSKISEEETFLQKETGRIVRLIFLLALCFSALLVIVYGVTRGNWLQGLLSGLTLAMAMLPEEFPVVLTVFLALGAWRISQKEVLTRKVSAVEALGAARVLCVDKTGTLTQNKMAIRKLFCNKGTFDVRDQKKALPEEFHELVEYGILASKKDPFDPMEKALKELGHKALYNTEHIHQDWPLIEEYPLSKEVMALSHVWETPDAKGFVVSAKGAPEAIMDLCHVGDEEKGRLVGAIDAMAGDGLRVLGVAKASFDKQRLPSSQHDFDFRFVGLIGLADPIRPTVPAAIQECYQAGIRVVMITGDYAVTAVNIARQIGLKDPDEILCGPDLEKIGFEELREKLKTVNVFCRVVPEQKLLIVRALQANGEIVAMTGDGVNDAPALKAANIGVAMGERGTDVAREASDLVLLNDDFSSIVAAVRLGRRIFDNLKKAMAYIIAVHIPIAGMSLIPAILGWPIIFYPAHIVFLELIIDPACSIVFESEPAEEHVMKRPPRSARETLFGRRMLALSLLQGIYSLAVTIAVFHTAIHLGQTYTAARTLSFVTLIVSNICLILTNRSWTRSIIASFSVKNAALLGVIGGVVVFLCAVIYTPFLQRLFHFSALRGVGLLICFSAGILSVLWFELAKVLSRRMRIDLVKF